MTKDRYLELLKWALTDYHRIDRPEYRPIEHHTFRSYKKVVYYLNKLLAWKGFTICKIHQPDKESRYYGHDWPLNAESMIGIKRLENIEHCLNEILKNNIEGDLIETGVWRGGAVIYMKALLKVNHDLERKIWVADSFRGLPRPNEESHEQDLGDIHYTRSELAVSKDIVEQNFKKYDLFDENIRFLEGWFKDTLPQAPIEKLALIRLDGDMYQSTMDGLKNLYSKLTIGGFIIIDDWGAVNGCKQAVLDFRAAHNISDEIIPIDWGGVYWKKTN
jgi:O-methyltransferase